LDGEIYFESHTPLEDDTVSADERLELLLEKWNGETDTGFSEQELQHAHSIAAVANGIPYRLDALDDVDVMTRARVVRNTVEIDPEAPTLAEVREMIDEAVREGDEELQESTGSVEVAPEALR
jgi:hypothetical protein